MDPAPLPRQISRYAIERLLQRTALSEVFLGLDPSGKRVCLKRPTATGAEDPESSLRFRREASLLGAVDHPSIVRVLDVGDEADIPYICFEYVEGQTLEKLLEPG